MSYSWLFIPCSNFQQNTSHLPINQVLQIFILREYLIQPFSIKSREHKIANAKFLSQFHVVNIYLKNKSEILKFLRHASHSFTWILILHTYQESTVHPHMSFMYLCEYIASRMHLINSKQTCLKVKNHFLFKIDFCQIPDMLMIVFFQYSVIFTVFLKPIQC